KYKLLYLLRFILIKSNNLKPIRHRSYYLYDASYANCEEFFTPFRGQRYHLKEWRAGRLTTPKKYYNMKHSGAHNVIERAFGLLEMRWSILRDTTWFSPEVVGRLVHACCLLHNFIKREAGMDDLERAYLQRALMDLVSGAEEVEEVVAAMQPTPEWTHFRN
ncbi:Putative nuclease HARBI1, partial [Linum perenne]